MEIPRGRNLTANLTIEQMKVRIAQLEAQLQAKAKPKPAGVRFAKHDQQSRLQETVINHATTLRKYQVETLGAIVNAYDAGVRRQLLAMATGTGKTVIFANLLQAMNHRIPGQMWVIAHREELIDQAVTKMRHWNPSLIVDKEIAEHYANPFADVIVSCVASIGRKGTKRSGRFDWNAVTKVVIDEAHHTPAGTYMNFLELTGVMTNSRKLLLGVTATPKRGDGKALAQIYQKIVYSYPIRNAIEDGWLVDLRGYRIRSATNLDDVRTTAGDFQTDELSGAVNNDTRNQLVVKGWMDRAEGKQTVCFCVDIAHAKDLAQTFRRYGIKAKAVWGSDPDRAEKLRAHKAREITVLCNCGVLTEGYDDWRIGCIVLARPTKSGSLYTQMVGRGTRLQEGTDNLIEAIAAGVKLEKTECILIDVCDTTSRHSLQTVPSLLGIDSYLDLNGQLAVNSIKALEQAEAANPHIDFSKLDDITKLKAFIESVNLWHERATPKKIATASKLDWHKLTDSSYFLMLKSEEVDHFYRGSNKIPIYEQKTVYIKENLLGKFEIISIIRTTAGSKIAASTAIKSRGEANTLQEAFRAADRAVCDAAQVRHPTTTTETSKEALAFEQQRMRKRWANRPRPTRAALAPPVTTSALWKPAKLKPAKPTNSVKAATSRYQEPFALGFSLSVPPVRAGYSTATIEYACVCGVFSASPDKCPRCGRKRQRDDTHE